MLVSGKFRVRQTEECGTLEAAMVDVFEILLANVIMVSCLLANA